MWLSSSLVARLERPHTLSDSLKVCSPETLPNLLTLFKLWPAHGGGKSRALRESSDAH